MSQNTNDEQAKYGANREPMLTDVAISGHYPMVNEYDLGEAAKWARDFYEDLIDRGVLIMGPWVQPRVCKRSDGLYYRNDPMELAPVTGIFTEITKEEYDRLVSQGAKIIEA